jgi:hypothetical protein
VVGRLKSSVVETALAIELADIASAPAKRHPAARQVTFIMGNPSLSLYPVSSQPAHTTQFVA